MEKRRRITIEMKDGDYLDNELWDALQKFSNSAAIIKDMLKGLVPLPILEDKEENNVRDKCIQRK